MVACGKLAVMRIVRTFHSECVLIAEALFVLFFVCNAV